MTRENYEKMTLAELKEIAKNLGIKNISKLNAVTDVLLQKEKIDGDEFREIFKNS